MKTYKVYEDDYKVNIIAEKYHNNTLAISLVTDKGEPYADLTVNLADSRIWANDTTAFVDTNNCPWAEQFIVNNGLGTPMGIISRSGFCTYPLYKFNVEKFS